MNTIRIDTKFFAILRETINKTDDSILLPSNSTVNDFLQKLISDYGTVLSKILLNDDGLLNEQFTTLLNGQSITVDSFSNIRLADNDLLIFLPPVSGG
jgi:MoaD family protein|tara:strand:- start:1323 stop:1616 length:294 start_codon:yes stop_codon:yes gene_type:complete